MPKAKQFAGYAIVERKTGRFVENLLTGSPMLYKLRRDAESQLASDWFFADRESHAVVRIVLRHGSAHE